MLVRRSSKRQTLARRTPMSCAAASVTRCRALSISPWMSASERISRAVTSRCSDKTSSTLGGSELGGVEMRMRGRVYAREAGRDAASHAELVAKQRESLARARAQLLLDEGRDLGLSRVDLDGERAAPPRIDHGLGDVR